MGKIDELKKTKFDELKEKIKNCILNTNMADIAATKATEATGKLSNSYLTNSIERHTTTINRSNAISQAAELACSSEFQSFYKTFKDKNNTSNLSIINFVKLLNNNNTLNENVSGGRRRMRRKTSRKRHGKRSRRRRYRRKSRKHYR